MKLSYENFRIRYLRQAEVLCRGIGHPELAEKLCEFGFEAVMSSPEDFSNHRDVYVKLAEIVYSWDAPTELLAQRIYPKITIPSDKDLISSEEAIEKLLPILREFYLYDRIIMSLALLGWNNGQIAQLFNELIDKFSNEITSANTLIEVDKVLNRFVKTLTDKILFWHDIDDWFPELVEYKNSPKSDYETWQFLERLCYQPEDLRFARKNSPYKDKFGKLRDRYHYGKKQIQAQLKETDFFKPKRIDDKNER